jgi:RNA polymerase sigma-70 factor (ECF subfamily)
VSVGADDEALVRRAQAGDRVAFGDLVQRYQRPVYGFVYRLLPNQEVAADVTQEVFVRAWTYLGRFDACRPLRPWLYRIAANRASSRRSREQAQAVLGLDDLESEPASGVTPAGEFERTELAGEVRRAVAGLSPQQRDAIVLVELEGQTAIEAAEVMGCSPATVRQHVFRGKKRLRDLLAGYVLSRSHEAER